MTDYEVVNELIRFTDIIRENIGAGLAVTPALTAAAVAARAAVNELLAAPKPDYPRPPVILVRQGREYAPPARPRRYVVDTASVTR